VSRPGQTLSIVPLDQPGHYRLEGELDITNADELSELMEGELRAGRHVFLDLSDLGFMDSSGIRALIRISKVGQEVGTPPLVLYSVSAPVRQLLAVALPSGIPGVEIKDGRT
jgi:anti-anti-sigma factor